MTPSCDPALGAPAVPAAPPVPPAGVALHDALAPSPPGRPATPGKPNCPPVAGGASPAVIWLFVILTLVTFESMTPYTRMPRTKPSAGVRIRKPSTVTSERLAP